MVMPHLCDLFHEAADWTEELPKCGALTKPCKWASVDCHSIRKMALVRTCRRLRFYDTAVGLKKIVSAQASSRQQRHHPVQVMLNILL